LYLLAIVVVLATSRRQHDPHKGVAQGCLGFVVLALVILLGLLALAITQRVAWLSYLLLFIAIFPGIGLIGGGITHLIQRRKERRFIDDAR
jgi:cytochrome bd-type quinol oxidase subunit 2